MIWGETNDRLLESSWVRFATEWTEGVSTVRLHDPQQPHSSCQVHECPKCGKHSSVKQQIQMSFRE